MLFFVFFSILINRFIIHLLRTSLFEAHRQQSQKKVYFLSLSVFVLFVTYLNI
jgi:hypothetical protein